MKTKIILFISFTILYLLDGYFLAQFMAHSPELEANPFMLFIFNHGQLFSVTIVKLMALGLLGMVIPFIHVAVLIVLNVIMIPIVYFGYLMS
jgi:hypothetical protein